MSRSPELEGPRLHGLSADAAGFIPIDEHARVIGLEDVYAAGDAVAFPIKQGGIATQQADAAVQAIAASLGAELACSPLGAGATSDVADRRRTDLPARPRVPGRFVFTTRLAADPLWWPPTKIAGRCLGAYLAHAAHEVNGTQLEHR